MIKMDIQNNLDQMKKKLEGVDSRKWKAILKTTTNQTANAVMIQEQRDIRQRIDRPTPWTVNSMYVKRGTGSNVDATVTWKDGNGLTSARHYLMNQVEGGVRQLKPFEKKLQGLGLMPTGYVAVPAKGAPLDGYGNVSGGLIQAIIMSLTQSRISISKVRGKVSSRAKKKSYIAITEKTPELSMGIYQRVAMGLGEALRPIFHYVNKAHYKRKFPFYEIGKSVSRKTFSNSLNKAIKDAN